MTQILIQKLKIAKRAVILLQLVPYIRMIALCNSVAKGKVCAQSDIDLFIIARHNHIFTVRYFTIFFLTLFGLKTYPQKGICANRVCTSFFLSDYSLNLDRLNTGKRDRLLRADWILNLIPIFNDSNAYMDFVDKNSWIKKYYKSYYLDMSVKSRNISVSIGMFILRKMLELIFYFGIGWIVEKIVRHIQIQRLMRFKHAHHGEERMVINDQIIKLHYRSDDKKRDLF